MARWSATAEMILALFGSALPCHASVLSQWVQFAPNDTVLLRAIESDPASGCPAAAVDGSPVTLTPRGTVTTPEQAPKTYFPVLMCEVSVSAFGHQSASIGGVTLKMPLTEPRRILVVGDTGCRVTAAVAGTQNCNDPTQFPLQFLANYAASFKPDLIIHVGDFFYREQPCPAGFTGCAGSPAFDNWDSWYADWFGPAKNLLAAAPLAISRGNHESCNRGAHGWFRLLDPFPYNPDAVDCVGQFTPMPGTPGNGTATISPHDTTTPYVVRAGQVSLLMFDSSDSDTSAPDTKTRTQDGTMTLPQLYTAQLQAVLPSLAGTDVFYVTHKSSYDIRPATLNGALAGGDATQQSVFDAITPGGVPAPIKLLISGHDHQFEVVDFANGSYAPQLTSGVKACGCVPLLLSSSVPLLPVVSCGA